jgi:Delta7-sterol 5-desaturase
MSKPTLIVLLTIALLGHIMAAVWYVAAKNKWEICRRTIYDLPFRPDQVRRELMNSIHAPIHAVVLAGFVFLGFFRNTTLTSYVLSGLATTAWAEIWHYGSHRAFHLRALEWIHLEHHRSLVNSPFTAISFSLWEKLVFNFGLLAPLALADSIYSLNFFGIATWYMGYLLINSFSHANFELKPEDYNRWSGRVVTSTTYHSLHHARYVGNYGLGTRVLDKLFRTEWEDYERLYDRISLQRKPLIALREKVEGDSRL